MGAPFGSNHASKSEPNRRKPDIIAGKDFLSLFMEAAPSSSSSSKRINQLESTSTITSPTATNNTYEQEITVTMVYDDNSNTSNTYNDQQTTSTLKSPTVHQEDNDLITEESEQQKTIIRDSRSSSIYPYNYKEKEPEIYEENEDHPYYPSISETELANSSEQAQVLSIRVSSSVGQSPSRKTNYSQVETSTILQLTPENVLVSEQDNDGTRNAASASKSLLNIDEMEPMTIDNNNPIKELHETFKETQRQLGANPDYLEQQRYKQLQKLHPVQHPYHHSVVFHGHSKDGNRARSVSYSSVIQNIQPAVAERNWEQAESIERPTYLQNSQTVINKDTIDRNYNLESLKIVSTSPGYQPWRQVENKDIVETYQDNIKGSDKIYQQSEVQWGQPERNQEYLQHKNTGKETSTTTTPPIYQQEEIQWGQPEVNYEESYKQPTQTPKYIPPVYATEEQNYEVDESVSVMTNGRAHGVQERPQPQPVIPLQQTPETVQQTQEQTVPSAEKTDNNHKVGYVVEGRNFRKYRVEERTSDGFVVGEYGVVNHDDGSLRGVRYTADGTINPRLIYDALMKFLSL